MTPDIFGYERNVKKNAILSSEHCVLDFGEGKTGLVQQVSVEYQHNITPVFETGSTDLYFVNGKPMGSLTCASIVGSSGFFDGLGLGTQACGELSTLSITADNGDCSVKIEKNNGLRMESALLQSVKLSYTTGQQDISVMQNASFLIGKLIRTTS